MKTEVMFRRAGELTDEHPAARNGLPVLLVDGEPLASKDLPKSTVLVIPTIVPYEFWCRAKQAGYRVQQVRLPGTHEARCHRCGTQYSHHWTATSNGPLCGHCEGIPEPRNGENVTRRSRLTPSTSATSRRSRSYKTPA